MPTARRLFYALQLVSEPTLVEPIFSCDITAPSDCMGGVYQSLNQRRGLVIEEVQIAGTPLNLVILNLFRSRHICPSLSPSASLVCSEATPKARPSLSASSTTGKSSRVFPSLIRKLWISSSASERERDLRSKCPSCATTPTRCDMDYAHLSFLFEQLNMNSNFTVPTLSLSNSRAKKQYTTSIPTRDYSQTNLTSNYRPPSPYSKNDRRYTPFESSFPQ